jgi:hypothetical protein
MDQGGAAAQRKLYAARNAEQLVGPAESHCLGGIVGAVSGDTPKYPPICTTLSVRHMERMRRKTPTNHAFLRIFDEVR